MTEHTDKSAPKADKAPPAKRGRKSRTPKGKRATAPGDKPSTDPASGPASGDDRAEAAPAASAPPASTAPTSPAAAAPSSSAPSTPAPDPAKAGPALPTPPQPGLSQADKGAGKAPEKAADKISDKADDKAGAAKSLAPDPATVVFGSNRPIVATPPKLPESSGLRFAGPSAGELKASGPQPTSPKAGGLTFTSAKAAPAKAAPVKAPPPKASPAKPAAAAAKPAANGKDTAKKPDAKAPEAKKGEAKKAEAAKSDAKKPALTKPAIAPQATARRFDKERSTGGFVMIMLVLTLIGAGLVFWMKIENESAAPQQMAESAPDASDAMPGVPDSPTGREPAVAYGPSVRAPVSPGPLAAVQVPAAAALTPSEIDEIQRLLVRMDFNPGSRAGVMTPETTAAIRSYQEMAGLPATGQANRALLEELRSVAALYGS